MDTNARSRNKKAVYELQTFYGQLQHIFLLRIPSALLPLPDPSPPETTCVALAFVQQCQIMRNHPNGLDIHYYRKMGSVDVVDITSVQCLVARAPLEKEWALFDRSGSLARAEFRD